MRHIPKGFHTVTPNIVADDGDALIAFLKQAFGATEALRLSLPGGKLAHCELQIALPDPACVWLDAPLARWQAPRSS
jgi:PhnB protein